MLTPGPPHVCQVTALRANRLRSRESSGLDGKGQAGGRPQTDAANLPVRCLCRMDSSIRLRRAVCLGSRNDPTSPVWNHAVTFAFLQAVSLTYGTLLPSRGNAWGTTCA